MRAILEYPNSELIILNPSEILIGRFPDCQIITEPNRR